MGRLFSFFLPQISPLFDKKILSIRFFYCSFFQNTFLGLKIYQKDVFHKLSIIIFNTTCCVQWIDFNTRYGIIVWLDKDKRNIL